MTKPCTQCGKCCTCHPCGIGLALIGDYRPCLALEKHEDDKYYCGLIVNAGTYLDLQGNEDWKEEFVRKLVSEYNRVGVGCGDSVVIDEVKQSIRNGRLCKQKLLDDNKSSKIPSWREMSDEDSKISMQNV